MEAALVTLEDSDQEVINDALIYLMNQADKSADNGRIDLLALDGDGNLVVIEFKRDRTPREVIASLLDYASWASEQTTRQVHDLAAKTLKQPLYDAFHDAFGTPIPEPDPVKQT